MRRLLPAVSSLILGALLTLDARQAASPQVSFRAGVDLVDIDVSVLDRNRLPVKGLTAADFTIREDGKVQPIAAFTPVDLPPRVLPAAQWMAAIAPDVATNQVPREGRLVVVLIERVLALEHIPVVGQFVEATIDQLRDGDLAAIAYVARGVLQNFTADRTRLRAAIRQPFANLPEDDDGDAGDCACGVCSLQAIADIAEAIQDVHQRRKTIITVGTNIAIQSSNAACGTRLRAPRERALRALENGNVTVQAFDPTGLVTLMPAASELAPNVARASQQLLRRRGNLSVLPAHTGGRLMANTVRPRDSAAEVFRESDSYYVMGIRPTANPDGRFHEIQVKVNRKDVVVQARRGYIAGGSPPPEPLPGLKDAPVALREAVAGLWPRADVPLRLSVAPFSTDDMRGATLAVLLEVRQPPDMAAAVRLSPPSAARTSVFVGAFDRHGQALAHARQTLENTSRAPNGAYEVVTRLPLKPGRYEIRAALEDDTIARAGSVYTYVDVPNFQMTPVSFSGVLIEATPGPASVPERAVRDLFPIVPTVRREFRPTDRVTAHVRLYQGVSRPMTPGYLTARILDESDQPVFRQESRILLEQFGLGRAMDFSVELPTARLAPGAYVLSIDARHANDSAQRDVRFVMQP